MRIRINLPKLRCMYTLYAYTCVHVCWEGKGKGKGGEGEGRRGSVREVYMIILLLTSQCHKHNSLNDPAPLQALLGGCP